MTLSLSPYSSQIPNQIVQTYETQAPKTVIKCQCIMPDHIFENLKNNHPKEKERKRAERHLEHTHKIRAKRKPFLTEHHFKKILSEGNDGKVLIYNANHSKRLPGVEWSNRSHWDDAAQEAFTGLKATYDFYLQERNRKSIDGHNMNMVATVHYGNKYDNAYWTGDDRDPQMVFGDGDGKTFNRFTIDPDVTAHELSHGVTQYYAGTASGKATGIAYEGEAGGLNEGFSDIGGIQVKHKMNNSTVDQSGVWDIGSNLIKVKKGQPPQALRNMLHPGTAYDTPLLGKDPQVASMSEMKQYIEENGPDIDPHISSGIPNRAFALAATELGGHSWEKAGAVMYATLPFLTYNATFADCANASIKVAGELFKTDTKVADAFRKAWITVEVIGHKVS